MYVIMDERAYDDVDRAAILSVQSDEETVQDLQRERDRYWPGAPLVNVETWEILEEKS